MTINLLPKKTWKRSLWKTINIVSSIALVFNMSMIGVFIAPKAAAAAIGYSLVLTSPASGVTSDTYVWTVSGAKPQNGLEISHVKIWGCWSGSDIKSVTPSSGNVEIFPEGIIKVESINDSALPLTITVAFNHAYLNSGTVSGLIKGGNQFFPYSTSGPSCSCNLKLIKSVDKESAKPGDTLTYTIKYENIGSVVCTGTGVKIYDKLDAHLSYQSGSAAIDYPAKDIDHDGITYTGNVSGTTELANAHRVSPGESGTITFTARVNDEIACNVTEIPNQAKIWSTQTGDINSNKVTTDISVDLDDHNVCTGDICNPETGKIEHTAINYDDNNACTIDSCDPTTGIKHEPINIDDENACTIDSCNENTGEITHNQKNIDDENACTVDQCNEKTGDITHTPVSIDDQDVCTTDQCNQKTGEITHTAINYADDNACTVDSCDPITGIKHEPINIDDQNACTIDSCNESTGEVTHDPVSINDEDRCTDDACNQETGEITHTYNNEICPLTGSIKVNKKVDANADGTYEGGNDEANIIGFRWGIDGAVANLNMGTTASDQTPGAHDINENSIAGYHFVGWYYNYADRSSAYSCNEPESTTLPANINVDKDGLTEITLCNARDTGTLIVHKNVVAADGTTDIIDNHNFTINLNGADPQSINEATTIAYNNLPTGSYDVSEVADPNYILVSITGNGTVNVAKDSTTEVYIVNKLKTTTGTLTKTAPAQVNDGDNITYTINWAISGSAPATNLTLTDPIPANTTFVSAANGGVYDSTGKIVTWSLGTKNPGDSGTVTFVVKTVSPLANGTIITNTAYLKATEIDPALQASATTKVVSSPVLTITKTVDKTPVNPGDTVIYTVKIKNTGTDTAVNVQLTDLLPAGFTFTDLSGSTHTFSLGNLAVGAEVTVTYKATVGTSVIAGTYDNLAVASADNHGNITAKTPVEVVIPKVLGEEAQPKLVITKSVDHDFINPGGTVIYTVKVENKGDAPAINVQLQDILPAGFTFEDKTITKIWQLGDLAVNGSKTITYKALSDAKILPGTYENLAVAWADNNGKISTSVKLEVRAIKVLGESLPTTGAISMNLLYILAAGLILGFALYVLRLTASEKE